VARKSKKKVVRSERSESNKKFSMDDPQLLRIIAQGLAKLNKPALVFGEGSIESEVRFWLPSGSTVLDLALGGGYPAGRLIEIMGEDRRGKTSLGLAAIAQCQKLGGHGYYIDTEGTFDPNFASKLGVNISGNFVYQLLDSVEECTEFIRIVRSNLVELVDDPLAVIVVDSIANAMTIEEDEYFFKDGKEYNVPPMATAARKLGREFRSGLVRDLCKKGRIVLIFINQLKESPTKGLVSYGGRGIKYQASIRMKIDQKDTLYNQDNEKIGIIIEADILKNKVFMPFKKAYICFDHRYGIDDELSLVFFLEGKGVITGPTGWVSWDGSNYRRTQLAELFRTDRNQFQRAVELAKQLFIC